MIRFECTLFAFLSLSCSTALAHTFFIHEKGNLCDLDNTVCLRGSLIYNDHRNTIEFRGRVVRQNGNGVYSVRLNGKTLGNQVAYTAFDVRIGGYNGEIVDKRMRPDAPLQTEWTISAVYFFPDEE